jgi:hypothetical protein
LIFFTLKEKFVKAIEERPSTFQPVGGRKKMFLTNNHQEVTVKFTQYLDPDPNPHY